MEMKAILCDYTSDGYDGNGEKIAATIARLSHGGDRHPYIWYDIEEERREKTERTLRNLYQRGHLTPFEFLRVTFYVECPIYVARQLMRYRCCSYLERSLRYCEPTEDVPEYKSAIAAGMKREDARACLPLSTMTAYYFTTNMREMFHIFDERLDDKAQSQTRELVQEMFDSLRTVYPICLKIWQEGRKKKSSD